jgi:hypothetical protein
VLVKNFEGTGIELNGQEYFRISWDYISTPTGTEIGPQSFTLPDALITEEFILGWDLLTNAPVYLPIEDALLTPANTLFIGWYCDTFFLENYFTAADSLLIKPFNLRVPNAYDAETTDGSVVPGYLFRANGKNYPGQATAGKINSKQFPGTKLGAGALSSDSIQPSIAQALTSHFTNEISKQDTAIRHSWETFFGPNSGSEFSFNMFGLDREDYQFIGEVPELVKDAVMATLPVTVGASNHLYLAIEPVTGLLARSLNTVTDFKYGLVETPADLGLAVVDCTQDFQAKPQAFYAANQRQGDLLSFVTGAFTQVIELGPDRYEPIVELTTTALATDFVPGYKYTYPSTQAAFPAGFIQLTPTSGKYPATGTRPWNIKAQSFGVFNGKNTRHAAEFFFRLFKLRRGKAYNQVLDIIDVGPEDLAPLTLWNLPTSIVEPGSSSNALVADSILGDTTNQVCVRLPFSYKRGSREWHLAHSICKAFLQNYTIGYHEFVADYSAADEPVFFIDAVILPVTNFSLNALAIDENALNPSLAITANNSNNIFYLVAGAVSDNAAFTIQGLNLVFNGSANYEVKSSYLVIIGTTGLNGLSYTNAFTILVNDLNEAPTLISVAGFPITLPVGPTFGSNQSFNITNTGGLNGLYQDVNGQISVPNGGGGGGGGGGGFATFTNSSTGEQFTAILLLENNANPTIVANLGNNDPDFIVVSTYSLIPGLGDTDNSAFSINGSNLIIVTDYEIKKEYSVRIKVTTDGGLFVDLPLRINIVQVPEYPNDIFLSNSLIGALNSSIGTLSTADGDNFSSFVYTIVGGGLTNYLSIVNINELKLTQLLDGAQTDYNIVIRATDQTNLYIEKTFSLSFTSNGSALLPVPSPVTIAFSPVQPTNTSVLKAVEIPVLVPTYPYFIIQN